MVDEESILRIEALHHGLLVRECDRLGLLVEDNLFHVEERIINHLGGDTRLDAELDDRRHDRF